MSTLYDQVGNLTMVTLEEFGLKIPSDLTVEKAKMIMHEAAEKGLFFELISDKLDPRHFIFEVTLHKKLILRQDIVTGG